MEDRILYTGKRHRVFEVLVGGYLLFSACVALLLLFLRSMDLPHYIGTIAYMLLLGATGADLVDPRPHFQLKTQGIWIRHYGLVPYDSIRRATPYRTYSHNHTLTTHYRLRLSLRNTDFAGGRWMIPSYSLPMLQKKEISLAAADLEELDFVRMRLTQWISVDWGME